MPVENVVALESEAGFRALFEYATIGILVVGQRGTIELVNPNAEKLFGYSNAELIGKPIEILIPENLTERHHHHRDSYFDKPKSRPMGLGMELYGRRKDGSVFPVEISLSYYELAGEKLAMAFISDITQRKEVEKNLQKTLKEVSDYKYALEQSAIVAITDQKGVITYANDNFCKISKYSREELIGQDHRIINSGYHPKEFIRNIWVTIANGKIWKGELRNKAKDGTIYWVDTTIVPFLNEEGKPYQYVAIRADITSRKEAENELMRVNEALEQKVTERTLELTAALEREKEMNDMKSRFVSIASHEFRTPLSAILSSVSLMERYTEPGQEEKRKKHAERIKSSIKNLTDILNDFLSLDKLEHGKVEVELAEIDLKEFCTDITEEIKGLLKQGQHIKYIHKGETEIVQDKKILRNVLLNLLSNAIKYSPEEKQIDLNTEIKNNLVTLKVKDSGIGIPLEEQKHLFGKFFRSKNVAAIQGTGLGLNIVQRYVELMDGNISFTSKPDEGTIFTVEFPQKAKE